MCNISNVRQNVIKDKILAFVDTGYVDINVLSTKQGIIQSYCTFLLEDLIWLLIQMLIFL